MAQTIRGTCYMSDNIFTNDAPKAVGEVICITFSDRRSACNRQKIFYT